MATNEPIQDNQEEHQEALDGDRNNLETSSIKAAGVATITETETATSPGAALEKQNEDGHDDNIGEDQVDRSKTSESLPSTTASNVKLKSIERQEEEEDLEEGELKDDDDDDDEEDGDNDAEDEEDAKRPVGYNNNNNNNSNNNNNNNINIDNNIGNFTKDSSDNRQYSHHQQQQQQHHPHHLNYPHHSASGGQPSPHLYHHQQLPHHPHQQQHPNRRPSPNSHQQADLHGQYPPNHHHFSSNSNNNHYRYPPNEGPQLPMNQMSPPGGPAGMYSRGGPGGVGPVHKVNIRCRFYSKTSNKCTWGDHCRFEHRDESPGPEFDNRGPVPAGGLGPGSSRGPPPPMGAAERAPPYPPYSGRHQPYPPPPPPHGYPYDGYGHHHHSTPPPLPPHSMPHWRQQHSPYPSPTLAHPPESVSPALLPTPNAGPTSGSGSGATARGGPPPAPPGSSGGSGSSVGGGGLGPQTSGGAPSPGYPSPSASSSSAVVYERKHRLAYEVAPWNDRGYPPPNKYDRGDPAGYPPSGRGFYRNHYSREPPYGREPPPHMGGPYPGYQNYPSAYRGGSMGPHASHYKFMSSSQRTVPPDTRRSRSNKRGHDEDESSWSDSGSEDSILGQANYNNKSYTSKTSSKQSQKQQTSDNLASDEPLDQGSGTPPGEPLPEDRERQEMLLNKLKEIEDLMAKKKGEQEDPM